LPGSLLISQCAIGALSVCSEALLRIQHAQYDKESRLAAHLIASREFGLRRARKQIRDCFLDGDPFRKHASTAAAIGMSISLALARSTSTPQVCVPSQRPLRAMASTRDSPAQRDTKGVIP